MAEFSKTTDQALSLLIRLSENGPMTAAALARSLDLNRTVVHRLLTTLHRRGFVTKSEDGYTPGAMLLRIAEQVQPELRVAAKAVLTRIEAKVAETVVLHVPDADDAVVLDQVVDHEHVLRVEHRIGSRHRLGMGASGRALLAFRPSAFIDSVLDDAEDPAALRASLESVRTYGFALSHDELQTGVHGLAVPVLDADGHVIASLALIVPATRSDGLTSHVDDLLAGASDIATSLTRHQAVA